MSHIGGECRMAGWKHLDDKMPDIGTMVVYSDGVNRYLGVFDKVADEYVWRMCDGYCSADWYKLWLKVPDIPQDLAIRARHEMFSDLGLFEEVWGEKSYGGA